MVGMQVTHPVFKKKKANRHKSSLFPKKTRGRVCIKKVDVSKITADMT